MTNVKLLHSLDVNPTLIRIALSPSNENCYLAYSDSMENGQVMIYDAHNLCPRETIMAHRTPVLKMSINYVGTLLATCSCKVRYLTKLKGTIIRVFSLPKGDKIYTFKRGIQQTQVFSLNFNFSSKYIILSSSSGTIHIFQLGEASSSSSKTVEE